MAVTAGACMNRAAACLNDPNKVTYTFAVQLPYFKMAFEHFEGKLILNDIPVFKEVSVDIDYTANGTTIVNPSNMFFPVTLWERDAGSTDDNSWIKMSEKLWDETRNAELNIGVWNWRENQIVVGKCSRNRDVQVRYIKDTSVAIVDENTSIDISNRITNCLAFKSAEYMAKYIMNNPTRASQLMQDCADAYDDFISAGVKKNQSNVVRRRRYSSVRTILRPWLQNN